MDDYEKYFFDLNGYLVVENALVEEEIHRCNDAIEQNHERIRERSGDGLLSGGSKTLRGEQGRGDLGGMLTWPQPWCQPFRDLLAHARIVPYLVELLRDGFRLDHVYGIVMREGTEGHVLHGGGALDDLTHFYQYHSGRMRCGLTVVAWTLTDCGPGDGGFTCIPGSHKSNYAPPRDVVLFEKNIGVTKQVVAPAGSAIIFTEALTHGTMPWKAKHERRSILYKYSPGVMSYAKSYAPEGVEEVLDEFTPEQRAVLEPPYRTNRPSIKAQD